jgi:chromosome segregation ATPase
MQVVAPAAQDGWMSDTAGVLEPDADPEAEVRILDQEIQGLREELAGLIEDMRDLEDGGTATQLVEEQQAVIAALERRRSELLKRLRHTKSEPTTAGPV